MPESSSSVKGWMFNQVIQLLYYMADLYISNNQFCISFVLYLKTETLSNHCTSCTIQKKRLPEAEFEEWKLSHDADCGKSYLGSTGVMELVAMGNIFEQSMDDNIVYEN
ncbi:unnamed protein product, partial [Owenia fusiformis]